MKKNLFNAKDAKNYAEDAKESCRREAPKLCLRVQFTKGAPRQNIFATFALLCVLRVKAFCF